MDATWGQCRELGFAPQALLNQLECQAARPPPRPSGPRVEVGEENRLCYSLCEFRGNGVSDLLVLSVNTAEELVVVIEALEACDLPHAETAVVIRVGKRPRADVEL